MKKRLKGEKNLDNLLKFGLSDLKRLGWMGESVAPRQLAFLRGGQEVAGIGLRVNLYECTIELTYSYQGEAVRLPVYLMRRQSNLGLGDGIWYFICPITGTPCRTLYQVGKYFASRKALPGARYEAQSHSSQCRALARFYGSEGRLDRATGKLSRRYAKKHYRGKPTPNMRRVLKLRTLAEPFYQQVLQGMENARWSRLRQRDSRRRTKNPKAAVPR